MSVIPSMLQTMYQSDFQPFTIKQNFQTEVLKSPLKTMKPIKRSKYRPLQMDLEILQPFKPDVNVPFNLLHHKKRILQTNPHDPIPNVKLEEKLFEQKLEARRRRSAVFMAPQINMDIIPVDIMYGNKEKGDEGLISSIYSSDWKKACDIAVKNSQLNIKDDPMKRKFEKKDLIEKSLEKTHFKADNAIPPMEIGLEKYISAWDKQYPVEFVDTTKLFWEKHKETGLCPSCECQDSVKGLTDEETTELDNCLKEDALRTPFTLHPPGYTGYVPRLAAGIQFRKKKFTKYDPFVTTLMTSQGAYDKYSI